MDRCEACGSWQQDCQCILPPWRMADEQTVSPARLARLVGMNIKSDFDVIDALVITLTMLRELAETPEALSAEERAGILAFSKTLVAHAIERQNARYKEDTGHARN